MVQFAVAIRAMNDFSVVIEEIGDALEVDGRAARRLERGVLIGARPGWLPDLAWHFPTWSVRRRVFDWEVDEADVPVPEPLSPWELPERRQFNLYLRPAAPVVQR